MKRILIWGTGDRTEFYMRAGYFNVCNIEGFIDTYGTETKYRNYDVYKPESLAKLYDVVDSVVIANEFYIEIMQQCKNMGIGLEKIALTDNVRMEPYQKYYLRLKDISERLFAELEKKPSILVKANEYDCIDRNMLLSKGKYGRAIYMEDYFRFRTFEFAAEMLRQDGVPGDVAELGVFRGTFSALINAHFPDRELYLFDTFEGFGSNEAAKEIDQGRCNDSFLIAHEDTTVERALKSLPYPEKARVCKGLFPDTVTEEAQKARYVFVSLDVDFEESTYQGLKFFYPRMSDGGMIFVHDYHTYYLEGIRKAVGRYEEEIGFRLKKLPIADKSGSLIIIK